MAKPAAKTVSAAATSDAIAYALKSKGATWKFIATVHLGVSWDGANMDGGRALRAVNRAKKAGVNVDEVKLPLALTKLMMAANAPKAKAATPAKAETKKTTKRAPRQQVRRDAIIKAEAAPVVADEPLRTIPTLDEVKAAS